MAISRASLFRPSKIYGVPNWRGLGLFTIIGWAFYFSITHNSWVERWIFVLMVLMILFYLIELNGHFQAMSYHLVAPTPAFAGDKISVSIQILNSNPVVSEVFLFKLEGDKKWAECSPIPPSELKTIRLPFQAPTPGKQKLPELRIKMKSTANLFFLWQYAEALDDIYVLPPAIDHGVKPSVCAQKYEDYELSSIDLIRDPRLASKVDPNLWAKTGKPYSKIYKNTIPDQSTRLLWKDLLSLDERSRREQFSYWIKYFQGLDPSNLGSVTLETPFYTKSAEANRVQWDDLKLAYARWLEEAR